MRKVIEETRQLGAVDRVLLCTGRIYYDLLEQREKNDDERTAIIRVRRLYQIP